MIDKLISWICRNLKGVKVAKLKLGDKSIVNIDELRENYDFVDIFAYFKSGKLVVWCDKNGLSNESSAIKSLPKDLNEAQIHLKLYEILNGANNTPQWLREYFKIFENWLNKQDELLALIDKAKSLKKRNYDKNEAVENEIESLKDEIYKIEQDADEIHWQSAAFLDKAREQNCAKDNLNKQIDDAILAIRLSSLSMDRYTANAFKTL